MTDSIARRALDQLIDLMAWLASALLVFLVVLVCADVFARSTGWLALPWSLDASEAALYLITFLAAPWVFREQGHIAIEIFVERLGPRARRAAGWLANSCGLLVCALLLFYSVKQLLRSYASGNMVYETYTYAEWYQYAVPPPVFLILLLLFVRRLGTPPGAADQSQPTSDGI